MPDAEVQLADLHRLCGMHLCLVPESRTLGGPGGMLPMESFYNRTLKCNFLRSGGGGNWLTGRSFKALKMLTKNEIFDLAIIIVGS